MAAPHFSTQPNRPSLEEALRFYNQGYIEEASGLFEAYLEVAPLDVDALVGLGLSYWRLDRAFDGKVLLEKAIGVSPVNGSALRAYGLLLYSTNETDKAYEVLKKCVDVAPNNAQAWLTLGLVEQRLEKIEDAERSFMAALRINPQYPEAINNLGTIYLARRDYGPARECFLRAIQEKPTLVDAYRSFAKLLREIGSDTEALIVLKRGLRIDPKIAHAWNDLGGLYRDASDTPRSIAAYRKAIECDPSHIDAIGNLSCILANDGDYEGAHELCEELLERDSTQMGVRFRKAIILPAIMDTIESIDASRERVNRDLDDVLNHLGTIQDPFGQLGATNFYLAYHGKNDVDLQKKTAQLLLKLTPSLNYTAPHIGRGRRPGKIRIGICSRHLAMHTIAILWSELFARLDRDKFELYLFHTNPVVSRISQSLIQRVDHEIRLPFKYEQAQKAIADQELDILYYTDIGMEPMSYFLAFSRLATTQCVTWGHPLTTGIPNVDYFVSSQELEIPGAQAHYSEALVRLETLNTFYLRPEPLSTLSRDALGVKSDSNLYMCPQTLFKFHPDFDTIIKGVLENDPRGELVLLEGNCAYHTTLIQKRFERTIPHVRDRVKIISRLSHDGFLALVKMADVMLDPIHFGGGSTTIQALSFGTPVVTLPSEFLRARISYACYRHMGVDSLIARDMDDYCAKAVALGTDKDYRDALRSDLKEKSSVLFENPKVVPECEAFFERVFKERGGTV